MVQHLEPSLSAYPTSSSSLMQHHCVRLLWLPLRICLQMAGAHGPTGGVGNNSSGNLVRSHYSLVRTSNNSFARGDAANRAASVTDTSRSLEDSVVGGDAGCSLGMTDMAGDGVGVSGYEQALRELFTRHGPVSVRQSPPGVDGAVLAAEGLQLLVSTDVGSSPWENVDSHRGVAAVIVVLDAVGIQEAEGDAGVGTCRGAIEAVRTVFQAHFREKVCRCFVLQAGGESGSDGNTSSDGGGRGSGEKGLRDLMDSNNPLDDSFVALQVGVPVGQIGPVLVEDVAQRIVSMLGSVLALQQRAFSVSTADAQGVTEKIDASLVRTPMDRLSVGVGLKRGVLQARLWKKRGDVLVQLGSYEAAVQAYGETRFASNVDPLWCAATMESIAAARFQQLLILLRAMPSINETLLLLQSDATSWDATLTPRVDELEEMLLRVPTQLARTVALLHAGSVPQSMRQRLHKDVLEPLAEKVAYLRALLTQARACIAAGTTDLPQAPFAYRTGHDLRLCAEEMLRLGLGELDVYLRESRRQLRKVSGNATGALLRDREDELQLKLLTLRVDKGDKTGFLQELAAAWTSLVQTTTATAISTRGGQLAARDVVLYLVVLCARCGCRRRAIALLLELVQLDGAAQRQASALEMLLRACVLSGVELRLPQLSGVLRNDPLLALLQPYRQDETGGSPRATLGAAVAAPDTSLSLFGEDHAQHPDQGTNKSIELIHQSRTLQLHVTLLQKLIAMLDAVDGPHGGGSGAEEEDNNSGSNNHGGRDGGVGDGGGDGLRQEEGVSSLRLHLAGLLLSRYYTYLSRPSQETLLRVVRRDALALTPPMPLAMRAVPFLLNWEALPLPPHLAPKTVSVGGPFFTFIDTQRLKLTVLSLNGRRLHSRVVWSVGDAGSVMLTLYNHLRCVMRLRTIALQCRSFAGFDAGVAEGGNGGGTAVTAVCYATGPLAPTSYVLRDIELAPQTRTRLQLQVQPNVEGYLSIDGVELYLHDVPVALPLRAEFPAAMHIPVLQRLPRVSCTVSRSEMEVFAGQSVEFWVRVVNCGQVPIEHISLTAHSEACQLEDCEGCKERASRRDARVVLNKSALEVAAAAPLQPGDVVMIPVLLQAPLVIDQAEAHFIVFRVDCALPHEKPSMPPNIPTAVPVFGVIPRRVMETRMRLFHAPGAVITSVTLSKDRRYVEVRVANHSPRYSVELRLSALPFAELPDAFLVAGAEYVVPPIEINRVPEGTLHYAVPWTVRELPHCTGSLDLDLTCLARDLFVCTEMLDECLLSVDLCPPAAAVWHWESRPGTTRPVITIVPAHDAGLHQLHVRAASNALLQSHAECDTPLLLLPRAETATGELLCRGAESGSEVHPAGTSVFLQAVPPAPPVGSTDSFASSTKGEAAVSAATSANTLTPSRKAASSSPLTHIVLPAVTPVELHVRASAPRWRRSIPLRVRVSLDYSLDVGVLTGPVDTTVPVGEQGRAAYEQWFELFAFKTGEHVITVVITDPYEREITHQLLLQVEHTQASG